MDTVALSALAASLGIGVFTRVLEKRIGCTSSVPGAQMKRGQWCQKQQQQNKVAHGPICPKKHFADSFPTSETSTCKAHWVKRGGKLPLLKSEKLKLCVKVCMHTHK